MRATGRNIIVLLFTGLVCTPFFFSIWFIASKKVIEFQMEKLMKIENLHRAVLPLKDVIWIKAGKEILLQGRMFDIEKYSISGSEMTVFGLFDEKEKKLTNHLYGYKKHTAGDITATGVLHIIFTCFFQPDLLNYSIDLAFRECLQCNSFSHMPQKIYMAVISPPPDYV